MKKWMIPLLGLTLTLATAGVVTAYALAGDGSNGSDPQDAALPPLSAMCVEEVPDCDDMLAVDLDEDGAVEPDFGEDEPYLVPDRDIECGPDQSVAVTSDGLVSCVDVVDLPDSPIAVEPQPPIRSDEGIDPNKCNRVHNVDACEGTGSGSVETGVVPGPGIAVGEPYPLPVSKGCGPGQAIAITSDGQVSCFDLDDGAGTANDEPGGPMVDPQLPVVEPEPSGGPKTACSDEGMDLNECNWVHNINACFSDGQAPADIPMREYMTVLWLAQEDLSQRLAVKTGSVKLAEIERAGWPVYWPEEPEPGMAYIAIALAGFRMVLEADGQAYRYETDTSERVVFVG